MCNIRGNARPEPSWKPRSIPGAGLNWTARNASSSCACAGDFNFWFNCRVVGALWPSVVTTTARELFAFMGRLGGQIRQFTVNLDAPRCCLQRFGDLRGTVMGEVLGERDNNAKTILTLQRFGSLAMLHAPLGKCRPTDLRGGA